MPLVLLSSFSATAVAQSMCKSLRRHRMAAKVLALGLCTSSLRRQRFNIHRTLLFAVGAFPLALRQRRRQMRAQRTFALGLLMRAYKTHKEEKRRQRLQHTQALLAPDAKAGRLKGVGWNVIPGSAGAWRKGGVPFASPGWGRCLIHSAQWVACVLH